jgi:Zn-dependent peptidase ImmA (M78 family)
VRRGFKAEAKRLALEVRAELRLSAHRALDPYELAEQWGVPVLSLSEIVQHSPDLLPAFHHFTEVKPEVFSAAVIPHGTGRIIIENCSHDLARRTSTLAHEMSHVILEHKFTTLLRTSENSGKCRESDHDQEDEAAELSGELLIPFEAARRLAYHDTPDETVAERFGVSLKFARWRMSATGARLIASRAAAQRS